MRKISCLEVVGMAERSGDPQLDALIEEYLERNKFDWWSDAFDLKPPHTFRGDDPQYTRDQFVRDQQHLNGEYGPGVLEDLRGNADSAYGNCGSLARDFERFLKQRGINAVVLSGEPESIYPDVGENTGGHAVTLVQINGHKYTVDWTAAQYGFDTPNSDFTNQFPLVQRADGQGQWEREWSS